jgi:hypothetical protein
MNAASARSSGIDSRDRAVSHAQAACWSAGNALTSGSPIYFLAMLFGAENAQVGLLIALPTLIGFLRLAAPYGTRLFGGNRKRACLALFFVSYLIAVGLPVIAFAGKDGKTSGALVGLVAVLCLHQLVEYLALVLLDSWLGDLVPDAVRGTFLGARQFWHKSLEIPSILASGYFINWWSERFPEGKPLGYAIILGVGVSLLFASTAVLTRLSAPRDREHASAPQVDWRSILSPFRDARFLKLLTYGCWFSTFNGLTASPQSTYPRNVLGLDLGEVNAMRTGMRLGQFALSRPLGMLCDRWGDKPVALVSQGIVAAAPLCFLFATPANWHWIVAAHLLWSWYVGLNVGLLNWLLKLAPPGRSDSYLAAYFGVTGVFFAAASIGGGYALDRLIEHFGNGPMVGNWTIYHFAFLFAWVSRTLGMLFLARVPQVSRS